MTECNNPDHARALAMAAEERKSLAAIEAAMDAAGVPQGHLATWLAKAMAVTEAARAVRDDLADCAVDWSATELHLRAALAALDDEERDAEPPAWQARVEEAEERRDDAVRDYAEAHAERTRLRAALEALLDVFPSAHCAPTDCHQDVCAEHEAYRLVDAALAVRGTKES